MNLLQMSFTGAILIIVIVVIRAIAIHRLPKRTFSVLWLLAIVRLLCPVSVPSPLSIYSLVTGNNQEISDTVVYENQETVFPVVTERTYDNYVVDVPPELPTESSVSIWVVIWFIGMLFSVGLFSVSYIRCRREFRTALPVKSALISEWLDKHHLKRKIEIRQFSGISTPLTYGLFKPVILLPENMDLNNRQQLQYILYHEFVHIRHYDIVLKILATTAFCVHWFNPFVWVMYILFNRDTELTCDECVIKHFGREKRSVYAKMLISMEERKNIFAPFCNNFSRNAIEERIESIMRIRKKSVLSLSIACAVVVGTAGVFATSVQAGKEESTQTVENSDMEYTKIFNPSDWWTYEEYAEWLENEKIELQSIIGEKSWTPSRGDFVWTEELVEETIQMYEGILEEIRNGAMYSKFDDEDMIVITDNDSESTILERDAVAEYYDTSEEQISEEDIFKIYEPFGMTYDADNDTLTFNGKTVRWFEDYYKIDGNNMAGISKFNENGVVDVYSVRDFTDLERNSYGSFDPSGKLIGLREFSQEEFNSCDINIIKNPEQVTIASYTDETTQDIVQQTEETQILLKDYIPFGLNYEINTATGELSLSMNWHGKPVHSIFDEEKSVWIANNQNGFNLGDNAVDLEAFYENGTLTGLRDTHNHSSHNSVYVEQEAIAGDPVSDKETDSWLAEYGQFGVTYDKINNQWYFNGEKVRQFRDILTSNGEDLKSGKFHGSMRTLSGDGTVDIYTVRDFSNLNSDGNGTLIDIKAYSQEESDEHS